MLLPLIAANNRTFGSTIVFRELFRPIVRAKKIELDQNSIRNTTKRSLKTASMTFLS